MSKHLFLFSFSILLCWADWSLLYCNQHLSYLPSHLSRACQYLFGSFPIHRSAFSFCSVSVLPWTSSHTYIHTSYPHVSLLHSWMGETKYACFIIFFLFFCSLFCFVSCSYCLSKVFESALINIVSWQLFFLFFLICFFSFFSFFAHFLEVWIERKTYSTCK